MSTTAIDTTHHTHPSNATTQPGKIVLEAQVKRHSKAQKTADDLALKEAKEVKEALFKKGLERLAHIKTDMEKNRENILDDLPGADEIDNHQKTPTEHMDDVPATIGKGKKMVVGKRGSMKMLIRDAISNLQKKQNKSLSNVEGDNIKKVPCADGKATLPPLASSAVTTATQPPTSITAAQTKYVPDDALTGAFGDKIDDSLEYEAICKEKQDKGKTKVVSVFDENLYFYEPRAPFMQAPNLKSLQYNDSDLEFSQEPRAPFMQAPNLKSSKCKANDILVLDEVSDDESMVSDWSMEVEGVNGPIVESSQPEPIAVKKEKVLCTTTSTSVTTSIADNQRWMKKYLPTIMLWAGSYEDIWVIPDDVLLHHTQLIFDAVYKDLNIVLVHNGVVHSLTAQRISEWHSNFGSTAIVIIMDFMTRNADCTPSDLAASLVDKWAFLYENPGSPSPLTAYCSPFILQLLGMANLNAIKGLSMPSK
ncbi:hypothetical protein BDR05DRAFT_948868 [Suillus weaverae]|nr:hypothetical protein BDR05DRAFT_948868 [Suillus weaverae]